jgi:uncharacterized spore protein YtfJ
MELERPSIASFFNSLREGLAQNANVRTVYGEPIVSGNKTIIPVARIGWGFGGGIGRNGKHAQEGSANEGAGGGGGMGAIPVGIVEISPGRTRFIRFGGTKRLAGVLVFGVLLGMWIGRKRQR